MSWRDREYNRSQYNGGGVGQVLITLFFGSVPIGSLFGIRIRIHATLLWFIGLTIALGAGREGLFKLHYRLISMGALFLMVLMHEFGHCFASRWVGGDPDEIVMHPLGGLAMANAPQRWGAKLITVIGGPAVNVVICAVAAALLYFVSNVTVNLNPFNPFPSRVLPYTTFTVYAWWVFYTSYYLLLFNLLPIFPLDGGQIVQAVLWKFVGYYRSMLIACNTGIAGATLGAIFSLITGQVGLLILAIWGALSCYRLKQGVRDVGPYGADDGPDYSASLRMNDAPRKRLNRRSIKQAQKRAAAEQAEQAKIDAILEKVSAHGMQSLTWWEKRTLRKATERQRQRDLELTRMRD
jgi:Zn-dependent protease